MAAARTLLLTLHLDTLELDIDAPDLSLELCVSLLDRAKRLLETQEKIMLSQQMRAVAVNEALASEAFKRIKLQ